MGGHSSRSCSFPETIPTPPPPPPIYVDTGSHVPAFDNKFYEDGLFNYNMSYRNSDSTWFIWWDYITHYFYVSQIKGDTSWKYWCNNDPLMHIRGLYYPYAGANGYVVIAYP